MKRLLGSAKFWTAIVSGAGAMLAAWGLPPEKATAVVTAIASLGAVVVLAIGHEDAARHRNGGAKPLDSRPPDR